MIDVYFCHRSEFLHTADAIGYKCGSRVDNLHNAEDYVSDGGEITFIDNDFKNPDVDRLETAVKALQPELFVLPDVYDDENISKTIELGKRLENDTVTPVFVPKTASFEYHIPSEWRLGYSVTSSYGSTDLSLEDFSEYEIHLLGGSPKRQIELLDVAVEHDIDIVSIDTNSLTKGSNFGKIVTPPETFLNGGNVWVGHEDDQTVGEVYDWSQRVHVSLVNFYEVIREWCRQNGYP